MSRSIRVVTGKVVHVQVKRYKPYRVSPYSRSEEYEWKLEVELEEVRSGKRVFFRSPAVRQTITLGGPVAVVCFHFKGPVRKNEDGSFDYPREDNWLREVGDDRVARAGRPNDNRVVSKLEVGDTVTIKGRVKTPGDREGREVLYYVQLVKEGVAS